MQRREDDEGTSGQRHEACGGGDRAEHQRYVGHGVVGVQMRVERYRAQAPIDSGERGIALELEHRTAQASGRGCQRIAYSTSDRITPAGAEEPEDARPRGKSRQSAVRGLPCQNQDRRDQKRNAPTGIAQPQLQQRTRDGRFHRAVVTLPHGRTRMIVFPGRRSVELKAATASSRGETVPMFVRSRPSRTRWTISAS